MYMYLQFLQHRCCAGGVLVVLVLGVLGLQRLGLRLRRLGQRLVQRLVVVLLRVGRRRRRRDVASVATTRPGPATEKRSFGEWETMGNHGKAALERASH